MKRTAPAGRWRIHPNRFPITRSVITVAVLMNRILIALSILIGLAAGCTPHHAEPSPPPDAPVSKDARDEVLVMPGQWNYVVRDEAGHDVIRGSFTMPLSLEQGMKFAGSWQARYVGPPEEQSKIGPQIDGGRLDGELTNEGQIILNLNPTMADNNVR